MKGEFKIYHKSFTEAVSEFINYVEKRGYQFNEEEIYQKITIGNAKPKLNQVTRLDFSLTKNDLKSKKYAHVQIMFKYTLSFELNVYIS